MATEERNPVAAFFGIMFLFFVVPAFAYGAAWLVEWKLGPDYQGTIGAIDPRATALLMKKVALYTGLVAVGLVLGIKIAGAICRYSRALLLLLFSPGLHLTLLLLDALVISYAFLAVTALFLAEVVFFGRVHGGLIVMFLIAAVFGVGTLIWAQINMLDTAKMTVVGKYLDGERYRSIWTFVNRLASQTGAKPPRFIIAGLEPNFFVTEGRVVCLDGHLKGRTMYISLPLCRTLDTNELKAVLAHELAHYKGLDTKFSRWFYPVYRGALQGIRGLAGGVSQEGSGHDLVLLPALIILGYFLTSFEEAEKRISRKRELAADALAARCTQPRSLASALVKIHAYSGGWTFLREEMKEGLEQGKMLVNASETFGLVLKQIDAPEAVRTVSEEGPQHPTDTHPGLRERLHNLKLTLKDVTPEALKITPEHPAIELFANPEALEKELTEIEEALMVRNGEAQVPESMLAAAAG